MGVFFSALFPVTAKRRVNDEGAAKRSHLAGGSVVETDSSFGRPTNSSTEPNPRIIRLQHLTEDRRLGNVAGPRKIHRLVNMKAVDTPRDIRGLL